MQNGQILIDFNKEKVKSMWFQRKSTFRCPGDSCTNQIDHKLKIRRQAIKI